MADFYSETVIKSVRKAGPCDGCGKTIAAGESALSCSGASQGDFWSARYHVECRRAEEELNKLHDIGWDDDWILIGSDMEWEDWPWLIEAFPIVADRMNITTERYEAVVAQHERTARALAEIRQRQPNGGGNV
jgi:hypothetical protein